MQGYFYWDWSDSVEQISHIDSPTSTVFVTPSPSTNQIGGIIINNDYMRLLIFHPLIY